jgi:hypothetical protein
MDSNGESHTTKAKVGPYRTSLQSKICGMEGKILTDLLASNQIALSKTSRYSRAQEVILAAGSQESCVPFGAIQCLQPILEISQLHQRVPLFE